MPGMSEFAPWLSGGRHWPSPLVCDFNVESDLALYPMTEDAPYPLTPVQRRYLAGFREIQGEAVATGHTTQQRFDEMEADLLRGFQKINEKRERAKARRRAGVTA